MRDGRVGCGEVGDDVVDAMELARLVEEIVGAEQQTARAQLWKRVVREHDDRGLTLQPPGGSALSTANPVPCLSCRSRITTSQPSSRSSAVASASVSACPTMRTLGISVSVSARRARIIAESSTMAMRSCGRVMAALARQLAPAWGRGTTKRQGPGSRPCSVQQAVLDRVIGEVGVAFHPHLLEHAGPVRADRLHRQVQFVGDLRYRRARRKLVEDLELAA